MFAQVYGNLHRQSKALELLAQLQAEEFNLLMERDIAAISSLEFSIHELMRQIAVERDEIKQVMQSTRVLEYAEMLPEDEGEQIRAVMHEIDRCEQICARQAEQNSSVSLALLDQSHELMTYLHEQVVPQEQNVYSAKGNLRNSRPGAALLSGRY